MKEAVRQTRSHLMDVFQQHGFHPRTDLGQNFLIDLNLIDYIVHSARLTTDDVVLEVGAGTGGMTTYLAGLAGAVISVEIDSRMYGLAREAVGPNPDVTLLNCDALKNKNRFAPEVLAAIDTQLAAAPRRQLKLVANLPYSVATPVISNLVATDLPWTAMIVTIQWELAERMRSGPGTSNYGALSAWLQSQCDVKVLKKLGPTVFWPRPQVDSAVVRLLPVPERRELIQDRRFFQDFVRRLFSQRRKSLRSVTTGMYRKQLDKPDIDAILRTFEFKDGLRAESLDPPTLVRLSNAFRARVVHDAERDESAEEQVEEQDEE